ncbi:MAG: SpoIIE family protein phosphatase [Bacteroidia bacterium]|nr:SpoIIE family protein phosphatase [Bacteroidia bacterium]
MKILKNKRVRIALFMALGWGLFFFVLFLLRNVFTNNHSPKKSAKDFSEILSSESSFIIIPESFPDSVPYSEEILDSNVTILNYSVVNLKNVKKGTIRLLIKKNNNSESHVFSINWKKQTLYLAANIYLDRKPIAKLGKLSKKHELIEYSNAKISSYFILPDTLFHELIFSFQIYSDDIHEVESKWLDFSITPTDLEKISNVKIENLVTVSFLLSVSFMILIASFFHFMLYLFYRKNKINLIYSVSMFFLSLFILFIAFSQIDLGLFNLKYTGKLLILFSSLFFYFAINTYYEFFRPSHYRLINKIMIGLILLIFPVFLFELYHAYLITVIFLLLYCFESFRMLRTAIIRKPKGYFILLSGMIVFSLTLMSLFVMSVMETTFQFSGFIYTFFLFLGLFSMPISKSIYIAYSFGYTHAELEKQLIEVKKLSEENIKKEKEKQELLKNQNIILEQQVQERTKEIQEQKKIIEEKNKDILDSIQYATRIQSSILQPESELKKITGFGFIIYWPKDILSGDFYAIHHHENSIFIIGADCTGHGVPGALMSMIGSALIQKIIFEYNITTPSEILEKLNEELRITLKQDRPESESKDGMDVAIVKINGNELTYSGANRPLWYLDKNDGLQEIKPSKTSIGGNHVLKVGAPDHILSRQHISKVFLFSDGCTDQFGGDKQKKLSSKRFREWIIASAHLPSDEMKQYLSGKLTEWKGNLEQTDDILFLCIGF